MKPLQLLHEAPHLPTYDLPERLQALYGGTIGFGRQRVYANFVSSLDGVVALEAKGASAGSVISGHSPADRFVMGLLRACADAVLVGAGTLRAEPDHLWTAEHVYPEESDAYAELRRRLGRPARPRLAVATATGVLDADAAALQAGALVLTSQPGAMNLAGRLPAACSVVSISQGNALDARRLVDAVRAEGHRVILCEGGPHLMGTLVGAGLVNELFLTLSPVLAGRRDGDGRLGLVEGPRLLVEQQGWATLLSLRRHDAMLFLRYALAG